VIGLISFIQFEINSINYFYIYLQPLYTPFFPFAFLPVGGLSKVDEPIERPNDVDPDNKLVPAVD